MCKRLNYFRCADGLLINQLVLATGTRSIERPHYAAYAKSAVHVAIRTNGRMYSSSLCQKAAVAFVVDTAAL